MAKHPRVSSNREVNREFGRLLNSLLICFYLNADKPNAALRKCAKGCLKTTKTPEIRIMIQAMLKQPLLIVWLRKRINDIQETTTIPQFLKWAESGDTKHL